MSRWTNTSAQAFKKHYTIYPAPPNYYRITTDQGTFDVTRRYLNYKETIANMKKAGYTNINICCLGKNVTWQTITTEDLKKRGASNEI